MADQKWGLIYYQDTTPAGTEVQKGNLWIKTSTLQLCTYSGSAWVSVNQAANVPLLGTAALDLTTITNINNKVNALITALRNSGLMA